MLLKFGDIVILMNILSIGKQTGYARSKGKRIPCFFVAPYVRPPLFVSLNHTIFNEDIFRRVWWNHLTCHYIAVTLHFAVGLHRLRRKGGGLAPGVFRHTGEVVRHGADKGIRGSVDVRGIFHGGQFVLPDVIIKVPEGTVQGIFHGMSSCLFRFFPATDFIICGKAVPVNQRKCRFLFSAVGGEFTLGVKRVTIRQKYTFTQKPLVSVIVYSGKVKRNRILSKREKRLSFQSFSRFLCPEPAMFLSVVREFRFEHCFRPICALMFPSP